MTPPLLFVVAVSIMHAARWRHTMVMVTHTAMHANAGGPCAMHDQQQPACLPMAWSAHPMLTLLLTLLRRLTPQSLLPPPPCLPPHPAPPKSQSTAAAAVAAAAIVTPTAPLSMCEMGRRHRRCAAAAVSASPKMLSHEWAATLQMMGRASAQ